MPAPNSQTFIYQLVATNTLLALLATCLSLLVAPTHTPKLRTPILCMIGAQTAVGAVLLFLRTRRSTPHPHSTAHRSSTLALHTRPPRRPLAAGAERVRTVPHPLRRSHLAFSRHDSAVPPPPVCVFLFVAGIRTDNQYRKQSSTAFPDMIPIRRSLASLQYENQLLRIRVNETSRENEALRARMRAALRSDLGTSTPSAVPLSGKPSSKLATSAAAAAAASSPGAVVATAATSSRALAERFHASTEFTRERARAVASDGRLILSFVNRVRLDFADSFVVHLRRLGLTNWLVGATDRTALRELRHKGVPCFDMSTNLPEGQLWASRPLAPFRARS